MNCSMTDCETCPYYDAENDHCDAPEESTTKPLDKIIVGE